MALIFRHIIMVCHLNYKIFFFSFSFMETGSMRELESVLGKERLGVSFYAAMKACNFVLCRYDKCSRNACFSYIFLISVFFIGIRDQIIFISLCVCGPQIFLWMIFCLASKGNYSQNFRVQ